MGLLTFRKVECMGGDVFGRVGLTFGLIWWVLCTMGGYLEPVKFTRWLWESKALFIEIAKGVRLSQEIKRM